MRSARTGGRGRAGPGAGAAQPAKKGLLGSLQNPRARTRLLVTAAVFLISLVFVFPLYWMLVLATHTLQEVSAFPPPLVFGSALGDNLHRMLDAFNPLRAIWNSLIVAVPKTLGLVLISALAGYGLSRYARLTAAQRLMTAVLTTLFLPPALGLIPFFLEMKVFGWLNTYLPLIIPAMASAFGVIWMNTYISAAIPRELYEAAELDGAGPMTTFWRIVLPIIRPGLSALAVWTFIGTWNDFQIPLIILNDADKFTMPLALTSLSSLRSADTPAIMLGTALGVLPVFLIFAFLSRQFISGLTSGAVKS